MDIKSAATYVSAAALSTFRAPRASSSSRRRALWMVSMARRGDERRREIVARAGCTTLYITLGSLGIDIFWGVYNAVANGVPVEGNNPFVQLSVISFTYAISLAVYRRKYGG